MATILTYSMNSSDPQLRPSFCIMLIKLNVACFFYKKAQLSLGKMRYSHYIVLLHYWPSKSSKVNDFHVIWLCDFLLVVDSNLGPISHHFWGTATYGLKHMIKNCGQTAADGDMVTIDRIKEVASALFDGTIADSLWLAI